MRKTSHSGVAIWTDSASLCSVQEMAKMKTDTKRGHPLRLLRIGSHLGIMDLEEAMAKD